MNNQSDAGFSINRDRLSTQAEVRREVTKALQELSADIKDYWEGDGSEADKIFTDGVGIHKIVDVCLEKALEKYKEDV